MKHSLLAILFMLCAPRAGAQLADVPCLPEPGPAQAGWVASELFDWQITLNGAWVEWDCYQIGTPIVRTFTYAALPSRYAGAVAELRAAAAAGTDLLLFVQGLPAAKRVIPLSDPKFAAIDADRKAFFAARAAKAASAP
jgi:hypothetical protein